MSTPQSLPPALVLGVDSPIGLTIVRELGRHGVPVHTIGKSDDAIGRASRYTRSFFKRPKSSPMADWLPDVIARCDAHILLAISEGDLLQLADLPRTIGNCVIATPRRDTLDIVLDKNRTLAAAQAVGIRTPDSWQPMAGQDFAAEAMKLVYPVVVKWSDPPAIWPRLDAAGIPFEKAEYAQDAQQLCRLLARYEPLAAYPLVQSWCPGVGFGQMLYMANGRATLRFQHERLREFPPSGGVSTLCHTIPISEHQAQMALSEALLARIGWEGPAMVEYRHDPATGRYWLMEINGRYWGSLPLASQSGACFAWEQYRQILGLADGTPAPSSYPARRARYLVPDSKRMLRILRDPRSVAVSGQAAPGRLSEIWAYIREFLNPRTGYYVWSWTDPRPLLADLIAMVRRRAR